VTKIIDDYEVALNEYAEAHSLFLKSRADSNAIHYRIKMVEPGSAEFFRANDKFRIVNEEMERHRAARDRARVEIESIRFRAQVEMDVMLAPAELPE
jgi:hypothetical protein